MKWKEVIEQRSKYFEDKHHTYEANRLNDALQAIAELVPPSSFESESESSSLSPTEAAEAAGRFVEDDDFDGGDNDTSGKWMNEKMYNAFLAGASWQSSQPGWISVEKELDAIEEGSELWKAEYDNCRTILEFLVELKDCKDRFGKNEFYEKNQPLAWEKAKNFLEKYQHQ